MDEPDYLALAAMGNQAVTGEGLEDFHVGLAKNQHQADRRGLLGRVGNVGGTLTLAVIDATGIHKRTVNAFPPDPRPLTVAQALRREQFNLGSPLQRRHG